METLEQQARQPEPANRTFGVAIGDSRFEVDPNADSPAIEATTKQPADQATPELDAGFARLLGNAYAALLDAKKVIKKWHDMNFGSNFSRFQNKGIDTTRAWDIYDAIAPEMKHINATIEELKKVIR